MPLYETFSQRQKRLAREGQPTVYRYDDLPKPFRQQVKYIWQRALGPGTVGAYVGAYREQNDLWPRIFDILAEAHGREHLGTANYSKHAQCQQYLMVEGVDEALDIVELSFRVINVGLRGMPEWERSRRSITQEPDEAIDDLNHRFRQHGIGYQFAGDQLIRMDSEFVHAEMVEPAIALLHEAGFHGPNEEFLRAHAHYRHGRTKEAATEALKAFESTMKTICEARRWGCVPNATAKPLINIMLDKELIPRSLQNQFSQLAALLEGLATVRNKMGGHGQGSQPVPVEPYFAAYALHQAAANIVLLVEAHKAKP